mmetsp:Transcript_18480/g.41173  ORF Transcript_18480/g.41173 Transcript_18480/m.41173 type:complete len:663 (+) Transcript_18480:49-2037(+)
MEAGTGTPPRPPDVFEGLLGDLRTFYTSTVEQLANENASLSAELGRLRSVLESGHDAKGSNSAFDVQAHHRQQQRFVAEPSHSTGLPPASQLALKVDGSTSSSRVGAEPFGSPHSALGGPGAATPNFGETQQSSQGMGVYVTDGDTDRFTRAIHQVQSTSENRGSRTKFARKTANVSMIGGMRENHRAICAQQLRSAIHHLYFDVFCAVVIMVNGITLGVDVQSSSKGTEVPFMIRALDIIIIAWYIVELLLRVYADRWKRNRLWNLFDFWMIVAALMNIAIAVEDIPKRYNVVRFLRFMRLLRVLKVLKLGKTVNTYFIVFSKMTFSLSQSMPSLLSAAMVIVFFTYITAVILTQTATDYRLDNAADHDNLREHYGSLDRTFFSLVKSIFNGQAWGELMQPLTHVSFVATFVFMTYLMLTLLCLLNVIHGVFVDSALQSTAHYKDLMVAEAQKKRIMLVQHLKDVFKEIDSDNSGFITVAEFDACLSTPGGRAFFEVMGLSTVQAYQLFRLIDADSSESVDLDEFCEGCIRFMGEAKNFDIQCIIAENRQVLMKWTTFIDNFEGCIRSNVAQVAAMPHYSALPSPHRSKKAATPSSHASQNGNGSSPVQRTSPQNGSNEARIGWKGDSSVDTEDSGQSTLELRVSYPAVIDFPVPRHRQTL